MLNAIVSTESMNRDEWLKWRNKGIGGSDASIICGLNKYKSPVELWMEKTGQTEPKYAGEAAYWGTIMEPLIREEFTKRTGLEVGIEKSILQHPYHPFIIANVDGIVIDPDYGGCIFEAKTSSVFRIEEWQNAIPDEYQLQVQHYMAVTGFSAAYVAVLIGGNQFKWQLVQRDEELINMLIKLEYHFWKCVETNTPPLIDGSKASADFLNRFYPKGSHESSTHLPLEATEYITQYENFKQQEEEAAYKKEEAINKLKSLLGDNEYGYIENRKVCWTNVASERLDSKTFKAEHPELYSKYLSKSSYRKFQIK